MSTCRARLRNSSNALMLRMSSEQIRLQVPTKLFGVNSWIVQTIRQWIPDCWSDDSKCTGPKSAVANSRNWHLADRRCWRPGTSETGTRYSQLVPWSLVPKTTMDCHSKLVLHLLRNNQPVQVVMHQPRQTTLVFPGPCDQACCCLPCHSQWNPSHTPFVSLSYAAGSIFCQPYLKGAVHNSFFPELEILWYASSLWLFVVLIGKAVITSHACPSQFRLLLSQSSMHFLSVLCYIQILIIPEVL